MKYLQRIALYLFFFSINFEIWDPFHTNDFFSISKLTGYFYFFTMIPLITNFVTNADLKLILKPIWLFFGLLTVVSLFNINAPYFTFFNFSIFQNIILFYILLNHERIDPLILEKGMLSFGLGSVVLALLYNAGIGIEYAADNRVKIFGDNQNAIGMKMSIALIILLLAISQNRLRLNKIRYLLILPVPIMMKLMAETGSRVAVISFVLAFIAGIMLIKTKKVWVKILSLTAGAIVFIFVWQFLMQTEVLRLRLLASIQEGNLSGREVIWQHLLPLIKENPIFGVGLTGYEHFSIINMGEVRSPHNVFLEVLCYTGFAGLVIFLIFLYRVSKRSYHKYKTEDSILPLILLIPVLGFLASGQILAVKIGWVIFAYAASNSILDHNIKGNFNK